MSLFDELVARYRNMNYGNLSGNNPSAVRSLLDEYNDRTYTQVLDPSQVTYLGDVPQNQWFYDDQNHLQFGMPGEGVQGGLVGDETTGTTGWPTYDPYTDYGDPGYAGLIPGEGEVGTGLISEAQRPEGSGRGPVHMREDLHAASKAMGWENLGTYQNPSYKDQGGDTFTFSRDLPYGQVYDQYGRKRTVDFEGFTGNLQGFFADPWGAYKNYYGITEDKEAEPSTFESSYQSNYDPNIEGSGGFLQPKATTTPRGYTGGSYFNPATGTFQQKDMYGSFIPGSDFVSDPTTPETKSHFDLMGPESLESILVSKKTIPVTIQELEESDFMEAEQSGKKDFGGPSGHGSGMQRGQHGPTGGMGGTAKGTARF